MRYVDRSEVWFQVTDSEETATRDRAQNLATNLCTDSTNAHLNDDATTRSQWRASRSHKSMIRPGIQVHFA